MAAEEVRRIIGYDRVMVYRFDSDWNGTVIAESQDDQLPTSYLGLHFPASDIPAQARRLYTINRLRCVPDIEYTPVGLLNGGGGTADRSLDMSHCVLRSVSPIHLEYLRNMRVAATLSVSLLKDGALWGLIACHHSEPRRVCAERRLTCSFLGEIIEAQISMRRGGCRAGAPRENLRHPGEVPRSAGPLRRPSTDWRATRRASWNSSTPMGLRSSTTGNALSSGRRPTRRRSPG